MKKALESMPLYSFEQQEELNVSPEEREAQQKKAAQYIKGQRPYLPSLLRTTLFLLSGMVRPERMFPSRLMRLSRLSLGIGLLPAFLWDATELF